MLIRVSFSSSVFAELLLVDAHAHTLTHTLLKHTHPQVSLVCAAQGCVLLQPGLLLEVLTNAVADHGALLVAQRADMQERVSVLVCLDVNGVLLVAQQADMQERVSGCGVYSLSEDRVAV